MIPSVAALSTVELTFDVMLTVLGGIAQNIRPTVTF